MRFAQVAVCLAVVAFAAPRVALGQAPPPLPPGMAPEEEVEDEGRAKPRASDERSGHFIVRGAFKGFLPVGYVAEVGSLEDVFSGGFVGGGSLGIGLSPNLELDADGAYGLLAGAADCDSCQGSLLVAGLGMRAHLVEGAALDPWIRFGMAYRRLTFERGADEVANVLTIAPGDYHGVDLAQISLGADFAPVRGFGFGPFFEVDLGTNVAWPGSAGGTNPYAYFALGINITIDPIAMASPSSAPAPATAAEVETTAKVATVPNPSELAPQSEKRADIIRPHAEFADGR
jgi:hypothetical protein